MLYDTALFCTSAVHYVMLLLAAVCLALLEGVPADPPQSLVTLATIFAVPRATLVRQHIAADKRVRHAPRGTDWIRADRAIAAWWL